MRAEPQPSRRRYLWVILIVTTGVVHTVRTSQASAEESGRPPLVERMVAAACGPGQRIGFRTSGSIRDLFLAGASPQALPQETDSLHNLTLERIAATQELRSRTEEPGLRDVLTTDIDQMMQQLAEGMEVRVIGADPTGQRPLYYLDKGATAGLERGMAITIGPDLVGRIDRVNRSTSVAYALTDRQFGIEVRSMRSGDYVGEARGDGAGCLTIDRIAHGADIREGDVLVTAASAGGPPPNLRVGTTVEVRLSDPAPEAAGPTKAPELRSYFLRAVAKPTYDPRAVRVVRVPALAPAITEADEE